VDIARPALTVLDLIPLFEVAKTDQKWKSLFSPFSSYKRFSSCENEPEARIDGRMAPPSGSNLTIQYFDAGLLLVFCRHLLVLLSGSRVIGAFEVVKTDRKRKSP
jgi:hypothetical protein